MSSKAPSVFADQDDPSRHDIRWLGAAVSRLHPLRVREVGRRMTAQWHEDEADERRALGLPAPSQRDRWPAPKPCCPKDMGGSHYHCGGCGEPSGMYGHFVTAPHRDGTPFEGHTCEHGLKLVWDHALRKSFVEPVDG